MDISDYAEYRLKFCFQGRSPCYDQRLKKKDPLGKCKIVSDVDSMSIQRIGNSVDRTYSFTLPLAYIMPWPSE